MNTKILDYFSKNITTLFPSSQVKLITSEEQNNINSQLLPIDVFSEKTLDIIKNTTWILEPDDCQLPTPLGYYQKKNIIIYMDRFCILRFAAKNIQDIPFFLHAITYEELLPESKDIERSFYNQYKQNLSHLQDYSIWCKNNNIIIDPLHLYHNEKMEIISNLKKLDEYENLNYNLFFPSYEDQEIG